MNEVGFINPNGLTVLRIHLPSGADMATIERIIDEAGKVIAAQPLNSVFTLTIIGEVHFDTRLAAKFREYLQHNKPYVKAGAVIGITGFKKALYNSYMVVTHREVKAVSTEEEGLAYLAGLAG